MSDWFSDTALSGSLVLALPLALVAGLVSFFSPCVIPLMPGCDTHSFKSGCSCRWSMPTNLQFYAQVSHVVRQLPERRAYQPLLSGFYDPETRAAAKV